MGTIVQEYGPIYGEAVNGTVQGRPNGSVFVPPTNTIEISNASGSTLSWISGYNVIHLQNKLSHVAMSQDLASYVGYQLFSDASCTTQIGTTAYLSAGEFNGRHSAVAITSGSNPLTSGTTYYVRAQLFSNGVAVATSNVLARVAA